MQKDTSKSYFFGKKILIGISGSIAAYKIPDLVRLLIKKGADVNELNPEIPYMTLVKFKESLGCLGEIRQTFELTLSNVK